MSWNKSLKDFTKEIRECVKCDTGCFGNLRDGQDVACVRWDEDQVGPFLA